MFGLPTFRTWTYVPPRPTERPPLIERFTLQGEGGYYWNTFNFVDSDIMYVTSRFANGYYPSIIGGGPSSPNTQYYTTYKYTTAVDGTTYFGLSGIVRFCSGNSNNTAIFRDGRVFWAGGSTKIHPWIRDNNKDFKDIFMPSSYFSHYIQVVLMNNGELRRLDLNDAAEESNPPIIQGLDTSTNTYKSLTDVTRIINVNQGHNSDCIVGCEDDTVWHVRSFAGAVNTIARRIQNLKNSEILFAQIGDPGDSCYVVLKDDPKKLYRLYNAGRHLSTANEMNTFVWLQYRELTPVSNAAFKYSGTGSAKLLDDDEYFIDGCSNEFHYTFLTNKHVHCFRAAQGIAQYPQSSPAYVKHTLTGAQLPPFRMATATSYAMAVELGDGFYLLSTNGVAKYDTGGSDTEYLVAYQKMEKLEGWTTLARRLAVTRGKLLPWNP